MKSRSSHVRTKIIALLLSLAALWVFAAVVTVREGLNLVWLSMLNTNVGQPIEKVVDALQQERRSSVVYVGTNRAAANRDDLQAKRAATDAVAAQFRKLSQSGQVHLAQSAALGQRITDIIRQLDALTAVRGSIDAGSLTRADVLTAYDNDLATAFRVYGSLSTLDDETVAREGRDLVALSQAREVLAQEDALMAGVLAAGRFTGDEPQQFIQLVGTQRYLRDQATADLPADDALIYQQLVNSVGFSRFATLEDQVVDRAKVGGALPTTAAEWQSASQPVITGLRDVVLKSADNAVGHAAGPATWVIVRLILAGGLGLIAVIASVIVSITTARNLVRQLERLRNAARTLADERLPRVVSRLQRGEEVDVAAEAPPLEFGNDEIGQVGHAFNAVQETAVRVAVEQAELRRSVRDVFLSLARRSQALVHRQLQLLDGMERREHDAEELDDLFRVDHLATRMRRNAENLIVLSGAVAGRGWRNPVPIVDVIRGALAEVEDYARVTVLPVESAALAGRAVGDVIHLLAELIENAVSFSPPYTTVQVGGSLVANGFVVEIEDRGLGMSDADLAAANEQLANPPEFNLSSTAQLGIYVVGRLSERHGIKVKLRESPYGGTTAIVLIPSTLVVDAQDASVRSRRASRLALQTGSQGEPGAVPQPGRTAIGAGPGGEAPDGEATTGGPAAGTVVVGLDSGPLPRAAVAPPVPVDKPANGTPVRVVPEGGGDDHPPATWRGVARHAMPTETMPPETMPPATVPPETVPTETDSAPVAEPAPPAWPPSADATMEVPTQRAPGQALPRRPVSDPDALTGTTDAASESDEPTIYTSAGLPWRRRQASLAAPLRDEAGAAEPPADDRPETPVRRPEEIRRIMSSYQTGTLRGRTDADQAVADQATPPSTQDSATPDSPPAGGEQQS